MLDEKGNTTFIGNRQSEPDFVKLRAQSGNYFSKCKYTEKQIYNCKSMDFKGKIAIITGGAQGIGRCIAEEFQKAGATICVIDKQQGDHYVGDLADKQVLEDFAEDVIKKHGNVDCLINNALPQMKGIDECSYEDFQYAMSVGVTAPFYLTKLFAPYFNKGAAIVNISSSRDRMSMPQTESYTTAKGGIAALTHALAVSLAGKVRVNSISPGWIDTAVTIKT